MEFLFTDITKTHHKKRWYNTVRTILTCKLDPAVAWLSRSHMVKVVSDVGQVACRFQIWAAWAFSWGEAGQGLGVISHDMIFELWSCARVRPVESHFPRLTKHDLIDHESPAFDKGHNPQPTSSSHQQVTYLNLYLTILQSNLTCSNEHDSKTKWDSINVFIDDLDLHQSQQVHTVHRSPSWTELTHR